jgi:hypothetical protein
MFWLTFEALQPYNFGLLRLWWMFEHLNSPKVHVHGCNVHKSIFITCKMSYKKGSTINVKTIADQCFSVFISSNFRTRKRLRDLLDYESKHVLTDIWRILAVSFWFAAVLAFILQPFWRKFCFFRWMFGYFTFVACEFLLPLHFIPQKSTSMEDIATLQLNIDRSSDFSVKWRFGKMKISFYGVLIG